MVRTPDLRPGEMSVVLAGNEVRSGAGSHNNKPAGHGRIEESKMSSSIEH